MPGTKYASIQNPKQYEALRKRGYSKQAAAMISNGRTPGHTVKSPNYGARAGETIAGNLKRGENGKFASAGSAPSAKPAKAAQRAQRAQDRASAAKAEADLRAQEDAQLEAAKPGKARAKVRMQIAAARRARALAARQARADQAVADANAPADPKAEKPAKEEKPKKGGGGGGGGGKDKPSDDEKKQQALAKKRQTAAETANQVGIKPAEVDFLRGVAEGTQPPGSFDATRLMDLGLIQDTGDSAEATDQGRRALSALERGDVRGYQAALQDAKARMAREAAAKKRAADAQAKRDTPTPAPEPNARPGKEAPTPGASKPRNRRRGQYYVKLPSQRTKAAPPFAVFKDVKGADRWLAITTTAYKDQDGEYISREAIKGAVAHGDATGDRGTLRYWHVPGFDLGDCDFQATTADDRLLLESGTFRSTAAAELGQRMAAKGWQMSPGFLHPPTEPANGTYRHIILFERSCCPPGRASNPYTQFITKETPVDDTKMAALKTLTANNPDLLDALLATATKADQTAQDAGAVYKDAPPWAQAIIARLDALEATKAAPPMAAVEDAAALDAEALAEEAPLELETAEMDDGGDAAFVQAIAQAVADALAPQIAALSSGMDLEKKMRGHLDEMKGMIGSGIATKDATIAALDTRLKTLEGEQPLASGYRASTDAANILPADLAERLKATPHQVNATGAVSADPIASFLSNFNLGGN